jgi:hypothetical protein
MKWKYNEWEGKNHIRKQIVNLLCTIIQHDSLTLYPGALPDPHKRYPDLRVNGHHNSKIQNVFTHTDNFMHHLKHVFSIRVFLK